MRERDGHIARIETGGWKRRALASNLLRSPYISHCHLLVVHLVQYIPSSTQRSRFLINASSESIADPAREMQICRAEDGQVFQVNMNLYDIAKYVPLYLSDSLQILGCPLLTMHP